MFLFQPPVSGVAVSLLVSGLTVDNLNIFCGVFMALCMWRFFYCLSLTVLCIAKM